jgi:hypothetical protein
MKERLKNSIHADQQPCDELYNIFKLIASALLGKDFGPPHAQRYAPLVECLKGHNSSMAKGLFVDVTGSIQK